MSSVTDLATCLHCIFVKESSHYKLAGKKNPKTTNTPKSPAGTTASSTQDFFPATDKGNLLISFPPSELHPQSFGSHFSHGATCDQFRGMRLPLREGRLWTGIRPPLPATPCGETAMYRKSAMRMRRSAPALRTEKFCSYNCIEELYAFQFRATGFAQPSLRAV